MKPTTMAGKKILATAAVAALLFATGCQANNDSENGPSPEATEQQTVTEQASPTVTETATEGGEESPAATEGTAGLESAKGEPVSTTNGAFTITPVGDWTAELEEKGGSPQEGYDRVESINLAYGDTAEGSVDTGVITDLDGKPFEAEPLNSWRLEHLDVPGSEDETYLVEKLIFNDVARQWNWSAAIVSKTPADQSEFDGRAYLVERKPSAAFIFLRNLAKTSGEASKQEAQEFTTSPARDEAIEMLKNFEAEPKA